MPALGRGPMPWANLERSVIAALWLSAAGLACAAFRTRQIDMGGSEADSDTAARSYADAGPCRIASRRNIRLQGSTNAQTRLGESEAVSQNFTVHLTVTRPMGGGGADRRAPFPVVIFLDGFQMRASFYRSYANRLASWGYVCVQYDDPLLKIIDDATELQYFDPLVDWLRKEHQAPSGFLHGALELDKLAVAGHSRGGKLAALLYAERPQVKAAFLIDPVDNTSQTPESARYPSAIRALLAAYQPFAMLGSGVTGRCNPEGSNYKAFYTVAAAGSWQAVIKGSGHMQFLTAGRLLDPVFRLLCPGGSSNPKQVQGLALPVVVAWMEMNFRHLPDLQMDFWRWMDQQVASHTIAFSAKSPGASGSSPINASERQAAEAIVQRSQEESLVA